MVYCSLLVDSTSEQLLTISVVDAHRAHHDQHFVVISILLIKKNLILKNVPQIVCIYCIYTHIYMLMYVCIYITYMCFYYL